MGDDQGLPISHIGSSTVHTSSSSFKLTNVLHLPQISSNLLSVHQFSKDNNCIFIFDSSGFTIQDCLSKRILFQGRSGNGGSGNGLYPFRTSSSLLQPTAPTVLFGEKSSIDVWHKRLGHPSASSSSLQHLLHDIPIRGTSFMSFCDHCQYGKSRKLLFPISAFVSSQPLEIVHSDVWGPSPILFVNGFKYYLIFIDYSRYTWFFSRPPCLS